MLRHGANRGAKLCYPMLTEIVEPSELKNDLAESHGAQVLDSSTVILRSQVRILPGSQTFSLVSGPSGTGHLVVLC